MGKVDASPKEREVKSTVLSSVPPPNLEGTNNRQGCVLVNDLITDGRSDHQLEILAMQGRRDCQKDPAVPVAAECTEDRALASATTRGSCKANAEESADPDTGSDSESRRIRAAYACDARRSSGTAISPGQDKLLRRHAPGRYCGYQVGSQRRHQAVL